jgi:hypothetical protein
MKAINSINGNIHTRDRPTYWPTDINKIPDVIDFYISKKVPMHYVKIEDSYDLDSDHSPIIMTLSDKIIKKEANPTLTNKFTDWESFQSELNEKIQLSVPLRTTQQLDIETEKIVDLIQEVAWNNTPQIKKKVIRKNYSPGIRKLIEQKRKARRTWQKTG